MDRLHPYSPLDAIYENLQETSRRETRLKEQETAHLRELAIEIASNFRNPAVFLSLLPDYKPPRGERTAETAVRQSVVLCSELAKLIPFPTTRWQDFFFPASATPEAEVSRICYQRNRISDAAYYQFAEHLQNPAPIAAHSFRSICEEVSRGFAAFGMVPLESVPDERIIPFLRAVNEFDLRIVSSCALRPEAGKVARFVLLASSFSSVEQRLTPSLRFAFSLRSEEVAPEEILLAIRKFRLSLDACTITEESPSSLHALIRVGEGDLFAFLLYLSMEAPQYHPMGLYSNEPF